MTNIPYPNFTKVFILKCFGCKVGKNVVIKPWVKIKFPWMLSLGNSVWLGESVWIDNISNVIIGNNVEIGANSSVDRAKFSATIIGDGCKIDNLVQIGHNSKLGKFCIMAGNSGLAGSVTLGNGVIIGGSASIKDHTVIGDGAIVGAGSGVTGDIPAGKTMLGYPAVEARDALKQWAILKRLVRDANK